MAFSITPRLIMVAAEKRGWKVRVLKEENALFSVELPDGARYYVRNIATAKGGGVNTFITKHKDVLYQLAAEIGVRIPETMILSDSTEAANFLAEHKKLVVKPSDQSHGDGVTVGVTSQQELDVAITYAQSYGKKVLLQRHLTGDDYRVLCIDQKIAAAVIRKPAYVIGDGHHSLRDLISTENLNPDRSAGYNNLLTDIDIEQSTRFLGDRLDTIPAKDEEVQVVGISNVGKGGVAKDVTDELPDDMTAAALKLVKHFSIGVCGIDFIVDTDGLAYLIEINTMPSLGLHEQPFEGQARQTPDKFLDWLVK